MKKMLKSLALLLAVTMVSMLFLTACGTGTPSDTSTPTETDTSAAPGTDSKADDTVYTFKIDYPNSENSAIYPVLVDWAAYIDEQSNGRLKATIYPNGTLGAMPDCVTNCVSGLTDGFWSGVTIYPGVFPSTEVFGLPMLGADSQEVVNASLNAMLDETDYLKPEWSNLKVVALHSGTASPIIFAADKEIKSAADMKGINLRISNAYTTKWFELLGANPVSCSINDGYEYIEKGIISGGLFFYDKVQSSALYEVMDYLLTTYTIYPLTMFCMNLDSYNELPDDLKMIIDDSGAWFRDQTAEVYNAQEKAMIAKCEESGVKIGAADDAFLAELTTAAEPAWQLWIDTLTGKGYDGQAIFDTAVQYIEKYNAEYSK